jgi:hypothetical protein
MRGQHAMLVMGLGMRRTIVWTLRFSCVTASRTILYGFFFRLTALERSNVAEGCAAVARERGTFVIFTDVAKARRRRAERD